MAFQCIKYAEWAARICLAYRDTDLKVVHCHDRSALPVAILLKLLTRARVLYDAHELETERFGQTGMRKRLARLAEKAQFNLADAYMVVSDSISLWYAIAYKTYRGRSCVGRNI
jgi:hypothetical protein